MPGSNSDWLGLQAYNVCEIDPAKALEVPCEQMLNAPMRCQEVHACNCGMLRCIAQQILLQEALAVVLQLKTTQHLNYTAILQFRSFASACLPETQPEPARPGWPVCCSMKARHLQSMSLADTKAQHPRGREGRDTKNSLPILKRKSAACIRRGDVQSSLAGCQSCGPKQERGRQRATGGASFFVSSKWSSMHAKPHAQYPQQGERLLLLLLQSLPLLCLRAQTTGDYQGRSRR